MPFSLAKTIGLTKVGTVFRTSLLARAFAGGFVATHIPIIALMAYVATGADVNAGAVLLVALLATVLGTGIAFLVMHHLVAPIGFLAKDLRRYRQEGTLPALTKTRADDIGRLTDEIRDLIGALEDRMARLRRQAFSDSLTGLGNRRWLSENAATEIARAKRDRRPLSVIAFDLDHFKRVNDEYGHETGDEVLIAVAEAAKPVLRPYDLLARIGGEEFCAVLPATDQRGAHLIAERLRSEIAAIALASLAGHRITASFGVHEAQLQTQRFRDMLRQADQRLYEAKRAGRNRVHPDRSATHALLAGSPVRS
ncbi:GGDEF domain-containing protein [Bosea sp. TND4EK4]|uniref:GGDEF domain-containing protein n=1 Tax=Bosea sp. TND4EK4 TaxID=1907408 RepID=UPI00095406AE|nr:GGDEF domain-containing protein [Bosea sp. TND4EK4]SIQ59415.1 diguanylate cyclase (GGDEF) domain-containing protein [Bosea sp. TND4EK4]